MPIIMLGVVGLLVLVGYQLYYAPFMRYKWVLVPLGRLLWQPCVYERPACTVPP